MDSKKPQYNEIEPLQQETHNFFGESKGRLKIQKRGWIGLRAHIIKEKPLYTIQKSTLEDNIIADYFNFYQNNTLERDDRLLYIQKIDNQLNNRNQSIEKMQIKQKISIYIKKFDTNNNDVILEKSLKYAKKLLNKKIWKTS